MAGKVAQMLPLHYLNVPRFPLYTNVCILTLPCGALSCPALPLARAALVMQIRRWAGPVLGVRVDVRGRVADEELGGHVECVCVREEGSRRRK